MEKRKSPYGILIPSRINHFPAGVVGNREYLLALKEAIESALEEGIGRADVFCPDGEGHYLFVKLEEDTDKLPVLYADFLGEKEVDGEICIVPGYAFSLTDWENSVELVNRIERFYTTWERIYDNLSELIRYTFFEKCWKLEEKAGKEDSLTSVNLFYRFTNLKKKMMWDENGRRKLPTPKEWRHFFDRLWRLRVPDYCLRTVIYRTQEEVRACIDSSLELVQKGAKNGDFEGVGIVTNKEYPELPEGKRYFLFRVRSCRTVKVLIDGKREEEVREILFPVDEEEKKEGITEKLKKDCEDFGRK